MNSSTIVGLVPALALTLLHTLWQGAAAAGLLWIMLRVVPSARSRLRYALATGTLLVTAAGAVLTLIGCWPAPFAGGTHGHTGEAPVSWRPVVASDVPDTSESGSGITGHPIRPVGLFVHTLPNDLPAAAADAALKDTAGTSQPAISNPVPATITTTASDSAGISMLRGTAAGRLWMPWAAGLWSLGVFIGLLKFAANWQVLHHWRRQAQSCADGSWDRIFARLLRNMGLSGKVRLLASTAAPVPLVIGWLRPVVLVPAQLFTGLTTGQLEALLVHELAHIRRHDFLVNLLQSGIGIFYFHHPCVRWISSQIRTEREHCCDDTAAVLCGGPLLYARALAALEDLRPADAPALCASATGSPLISRIRRLLVPAAPVSIPPIWPAALGTTALAVLLIGIPWVRADEKQPAADQAAPPSNEVVETPSPPAAQSTPD
ncbi:MAG: M56 family metallopeptidase, partial [Verrucomicrobiaceae bacterium]